MDFPSKTQRKRMKRFELSTLSLARRCSTTELHPHVWLTPHDLGSMDHGVPQGQQTQPGSKSLTQEKHPDALLKYKITLNNAPGWSQPKKSESNPWIKNVL